MAFAGSSVFEYGVGIELVAELALVLVFRTGFPGKLEVEAVFEGETYELDFERGLIPEVEPLPNGIDPVNSGNVG